MTGPQTPRVLFVCVHNSGRSQMAEAFLRHLGRGRVVALSAGTRPASEINPVVAEAMHEIGIDLSSHKPRLLTAEMIENTRVITMGCEVAEGVCPAGFLPTEDWGIEDPKGKPMEKVREIRDRIRQKVLDLLAEYA